MEYLGCFVQSRSEKNKPILEKTTQWEPLSPQRIKTKDQGLRASGEPVLLVKHRPHLHIPSSSMKRCRLFLYSNTQSLIPHQIAWDHKVDHNMPFTPVMGSNPPPQVLSDLGLPGHSIGLYFLPLPLLSSISLIPWAHTVFYLFSRLRSVLFSDASPVPRNDTST
jgi:hypothetical protein